MPWRWRRRRADDDFAREIEAHIALEADRLVEDGMPADLARDAARRAFGNVAGAQERFYESVRWVWLEQVWLDLRYAWRGLRQSPAFLLTVVVTLAIGLGLVTSLFTIFNAYVLRPFAVRDPYALHRIIWLARSDAGFQFRWRDFQELQTRSDLFDDVIANTTRVTLFDERPVVTLFVTGNFFDALTPAIRLGRGLAPFDARSPGSSPVAVLTDEGWARIFNRRPDALGREIVLNGERLTVVGILRPEFSGLDDTPRDVIVPLTMFGAVAKSDIFGQDQPAELGIVTRFRRGRTAAQVQAALTDFISRAVARQDSVRVEAQWLATPNPMTAEMFTVLSPVFAAFLLVLVAACANVSNVMLARANARHREIGMRLALGASRARVVRQLLTEGAFIAVMAGGLGLVLAVVTLRVGTDAFLAALPPSITALVRVAPLDLDHRVFGFTLAVAGLATVLFALVPALHATRLSLTHALRGRAGATPGGTGLRNALVVCQVTVSLVLLVAATTLVRNGVALRAIDLGFEPQGIVSIKPRVSEGRNIERVADSLQRDERVGQVAVTSANPLSEQQAKMPLVAAPGAPIVATTYKYVSPEYFSLLGISIVHGRNFSPQEASAETPVTIVSAAAARALWPGTNPVGRTLRVQVERVGGAVGNLTRGAADEFDEYDVVVVGVAADIVSSMIFEGVDASHLYLPTSAAGRHARHLLARGRAGRAIRVDQVQALVRPNHADPFAYEVVPLPEFLESQLFPVKAASWIGSILGLLALALSVSGLYGVLIYTLSQRTKEIGIRVALGATAGAVARLVVQQSGRLAAVGAAVGTVFAFGALKGLAAVVPLRNVSLLDPWAFAVGLALVSIATVFAALVPAWRASRVDPVETLRAEG